MCLNFTPKTKMHKIKKIILRGKKLFLIALNMDSLNKYQFEHLAVKYKQLMVFSSRPDRNHFTQFMCQMQEVGT